MIQAVIFDVDGTIVDSRHLIVPFYSWLFTQVGLPPVDESDTEAVEICMSQPDEAVFAHFAPDPADRKHLYEVLYGLDPLDFLDDLRLEPHALDVLGALRPHYRLGIATNRGSDMDALVRHFRFDEYVEVVVTARDVEKPKPSPDMLLLAAERLGIPPGAALYVGDTVTDGQAAEAAGMAFLCYRRHDPLGDTCLRDLRDLPGRVGALTAR
ncbi:MAG: HAD family hydrolase [Thermoleophilia bacterium]